MLCLHNGRVLVADVEQWAESDARVCRTHNVHFELLITHTQTPGIQNKVQPYNISTCPFVKQSPNENTFGVKIVVLSSAGART